MKRYRIKPLAEKLGIPYDEAIAMAKRGDFPPRPVMTDDGTYLLSINARNALKLTATETFLVIPEDADATQ
jgi:hypothetical protein